MTLDTPSIKSDSSYTWESLLDQSEVPTAHTRAQQKARMDEIKEHDNDDVFSRDESYNLEEFQVGKEEGDKDLEYGVSCYDLDWDQRSAMSSFSIYLTMEERSHVSGLDCSFEEQSFDTKDTAETHYGSFSSVELEIADVTVHRTECEALLDQESLMTEVYEIDTDDESEYEVMSTASKAIGATDYVFIDSEYGSSSEPNEENTIFSLVVADDPLERDQDAAENEKRDSFTKRHRGRKEKRSSIMAKMKELKMSL